MKQSVIATRTILIKNDTIVIDNERKGIQPMLLTKKKLCRLAAPYNEGDMSIGYAESQSMESISSKVILLVDDRQVIILFLNFFQTKVIDHIAYARKDLTNEQLTQGFNGLDVVLRFTVQNKKWRFRILKKIVTLGKMQRELIERL